MRLAFTKPPYDLNLTWKSLRFPGPQKLLDEFVFRSLGLSIAVEWEADIWVVESGDDPGMYMNPPIRRKDPDAPMRICKAHENIVRESQVAWGKYDIVISLWPFISKRMIKAYPEVLWCYREIQPKCGRSREATAAGEPCCGYDLYLDHFFHLDRVLESLPQTVGIPYLHCPDTLRDLVKPRHGPRVFLDSRHVLRNDAAQSAMCDEFSGICGLPVRHAPVFGATTEPISYSVELTKANILATRRYLELLGDCKYFLVWRGKRGVESKMAGESGLEAAALGLIVVGNDTSVYNQMICHPYCLIPSGGPPRIGLRKIQEIENDEDLQREILEHQDSVIWEEFWRKPLATLKRAMEMKYEGRVHEATI